MGDQAVVAQHAKPLRQVMRPYRPVRLQPYLLRLDRQRFARRPHQHTVDGRHPLLADLPLQLLKRLLGGGRAQLQPDQLFGALANAVSDVVAVHDEVRPIVAHASHDDVGVRVSNVMVVDRDPVELGAEVAFHVRHQVAHEGAQALSVRVVLRRDDEAELVAVALAAVLEAGGVRAVSVRVVGAPVVAVSICGVVA